MSIYVVDVSRVSSQTRKERRIISARSPQAAKKAAQDGEGTVVDSVLATGDDAISEVKARAVTETQVADMFESAVGVGSRARGRLAGHLRRVDDPAPKEDADIDTGAGGGKPARSRRGAK